MESRGTREGADYTTQAKPPLDEEARRGAERVRTAMSDEARATGRELEKSASEAKRGVADRGERIAGCVDRLAREFDDENERWLADVAYTVSGKISRLSHQVNDHSFAELTDEVRSLSKHPIAFLGGAFAIGLVAGRFFKSSVPESTTAPHPHSLTRTPPTQ